MTHGKGSTIADVSGATEDLVLSFARRGTPAQPSPPRPDILLIPRHGTFAISTIWDKLHELDLSDGWRIWNLLGEELGIAAVFEKEQVDEVQRHLETGFLLCHTPRFYNQRQGMRILSKAFGSTNVQDLKVEDGIFALLYENLVKLNMSMTE